MTLSLFPVHSDGCLNLGSLDQAAFVTVDYQEWVVYREACNLTCLGALRAAWRD